jgi:hypothetical protein
MKLPWFLQQIYSLETKMEIKKRKEIFSVKFSSVTSEMHFYRSLVHSCEAFNMDPLKWT